MLPESTKAFFGGASPKKKIFISRANMDAHLIGFDMAELVLKRHAPREKQKKTQAQGVKPEAGSVTAANGTSAKCH